MFTITDFDFVVDSQRTSRAACYYTLCDVFHFIVV